MKGSRKDSPPQAFTDWKKQFGSNMMPTYSAIHAPVRRALHENLLKEQRGLCVYCGRKLNTVRDYFHIEHFRPRSTYRELEVDYVNLFLSCGPLDSDGSRTKTCGPHKGNWFDEDQHIAPVYPDCTRRFRFFPNGKIEPKIPQDLAAQEMLIRLNLNHPQLMSEREELFAFLDSETVEWDSFWDKETKIAENLAHIASEHFGETLP